MSNTRFEAAGSPADARPRAYLAARYGSVPSDAVAGYQPEFAGLAGPSLLKHLGAAGLVADIGGVLASVCDERGGGYYAPSGSLGKQPGLMISPVVGRSRVWLKSDGSAESMAEAKFATDLSAAVRIPAP